MSVIISSGLKDLPLIRAALKNDVQWVDKEVKSGGNVNFIKPMKINGVYVDSALSIAGNRGYVEIVKAILASGLVNQFTKDSALYGAITYKQLDSARIFLQSGANPNRAINPNNFTSNALTASRYSMDKKVRAFFKYTHPEDYLRAKESVKRREFYNIAETRNCHSTLQFLGSEEKETITLGEMDPELVCFRIVQSMKKFQAVVPDMITKEEGSMIQKIFGKFSNGLDFTEGKEDLFFQTGFESIQHASYVVVRNDKLFLCDQVDPQDPINCVYEIVGKIPEEFLSQIKVFPDQNSYEDFVENLSLQPFLRVQEMTSEMDKHIATVEKSTPTCKWTNCLKAVYSVFLSNASDMSTLQKAIRQFLNWRLFYESRFLAKDIEKKIVALRLKQPVFLPDITLYKEVLSHLKKIVSVHQGSEKDFFAPPILAILQQCELEIEVVASLSKN